MRLLALADEAPFVPLARLVELHRPDLVVTLGDLDPDVLDPLGRFAVPVLGVYGNHDDGHYLEAQNATDLHLREATIDGVRFAGFEGSPWYTPQARLQYTERQARGLLRALPPADVLISHAPPRGLHDDADDRAHQGFEALRDYLERARPRLHLHGHTTAPARPDVRFGMTTILHVVGHRLVEL